MLSPAHQGRAHGTRRQVAAADVYIGRMVQASKLTVSEATTTTKAQLRWRQSRSGLVVHVPKGATSQGGSTPKNGDSQEQAAGMTPENAALLAEYEMRLCRSPLAGTPRRPT